MTTPTKQDTEHVPVLIVGAGLSGLSTAMFLGLHGTRSWVVERHPSTSTAPKARGQLADVMEALRIAGVAEEMQAAGFDIGKKMEIVIGRTVTGEPLQQLVEDLNFDLSAVTPAGMAMTSQERSEPILAGRATELGARVQFNTELLSYTVEADGVSAVLRDLADGTTRNVTADYLVAADGWRTRVRGQAGIGTHGHGAVSHWVNLVIRVDLGELFADREFALVYLQNPGLHGGSGVFGTTDEPGRYVFAFGFDPEQQAIEDFDRQTCIEQVRIGLGLPDAEVTIEDFAETEFAHRLADRYVADRVLLVGDAAHVMPPTGGQGGNTAVMDGFYLGWKLAMVVKGQAGPGLLQSHDSERRPYGEYIADWQYRNLLHRMTPTGAEDHDQEEVEGQDELGSMLGYRVVDGAVCAEPGDDHEFLENVFTPTGRPGSRLPHLWLDRGGDQVSVIDLLGRSFVLLTAAPAWRSAAAEAADRLGVPITVQVIGDTDLVDPTGRWTQTYGIGDQGASLIRPDRFVGWRTDEPASAQLLITALETVLSR